MEDTMPDPAMAATAATAVTSGAAHGIVAAFPATAWALILGMAAMLMAALRVIWHLYNSNQRIPVNNLAAIVQELKQTTEALKAGVEAMTRSFSHDIASTATILRKEATEHSEVLHKRITDQGERFSVALRDVEVSLRKELTTHAESLSGMKSTCDERGKGCPRFTGQTCAGCECTS